MAGFSPPQAILFTVTAAQSEVINQILARQAAQDG
jgi:hypothetical protein